MNPSWKPTTLALASVIKGGKEIAIIGHTDCRVGKISMMELTDRFKALAHFIETHAPKIPLPPAIAEFLTKHGGKKR